MLLESARSASSSPTSCFATEIENNNIHCLLLHNCVCRLEESDIREGLKKMWNLGFWFNLRLPFPRPPIWAPLSGRLVIVLFKYTPFKT